MMNGLFEQISIGETICRIVKIDQLKVCSLFINKGDKMLIYLKIKDLGINHVDDLLITNKTTELLQLLNMT